VFIVVCKGVDELEKRESNLSPNVNSTASVIKQRVCHPNFGPKSIHLHSLGIKVRDQFDCNCDTSLQSSAVAKRIWFSRFAACRKKL